MDISTHTGVAVTERLAKNPKIPKVWTAREITSEYKGLERGRDIARQVTAIAVAHNPTLTVIEGYGFSNKHTLAILVEIGTLVRDRLWKSGFQYVEVTPTQLKKFATGRGTATKAIIMREIALRYGFSNDSDNVCDALVLSAIGLAKVGHLEGLIKPQREVIDALPAVPMGPAIPRRAPPK